MIQLCGTRVEEAGFYQSVFLLIGHRSQLYMALGCKDYLRGLANEKVAAI